MSTLVATVVFIAYQNIIGTSQKTIVNLDLRNQLSEQIETLQVDVFDAYQNLNAFLLDPTRVSLQTSTIQKVQHAVKINLSLIDRELIQSSNLSSNLQVLSKDLEEFEIGAKYLMKTRFDNGKLFPSLVIGNQVLRPNRVEFNNAILVALTEVEEEQHLNTINNDIFKTIIQTRHLWNQMISDFRIYLANRFGSFDKNIIPAQEATIADLYESLNLQFNALERYESEDLLGFQSIDALQTMRLSAQKWFEGYHRIREIHHSDEWRSDMVFIRYRLEPLLKNITASLNLINHDIHLSNQEETLNLAKVAETQLIVMWCLAIFCLFFLTIILLFVERLVFKPIQYISTNIKANSMGIAHFSLPKLFTKETKQLVDSFMNMRIQVQNRQMELEHQALHDALTGLPNRTLLHDRLEGTIQDAMRDTLNFGLLIIDLDRFKEINDTLGHHVGDQLLVKVAHQLVNILRDVDTVARLGGDEFAVLLPNTNIESAKRIAKLISQTLEVPIEIENMSLQARASIGIAIYPTHGEKDTLLMQKADVAMYSAKKQKSAFAIYNPKQDEHSVSRLALLNDLHTALDENRLTMYYQPAFNIDGKRITSIECLVRWNHPKFGEIPASELIAMAEQTTMINSITYWVFDTVFEQYSIWREAGIDFKIAINMSVTNLQEQSFLYQLKSYLDRYNVAPSSIVLEITEHAMMANPSRVLKTLSFIHDLGVNLSIDDYGTGFSSLSYLKQLPVSELKIDKSFIVNLPEDKDDVFIVKSTIEMAHNLGLSVVAEGVESLATLECLGKLNCDTVQGYYLSKPISGKEVSDLLFFQDTEEQSLNTE